MTAVPKRAILSPQKIKVEINLRGSLVNLAHMNDNNIALGTFSFPFNSENNRENCRRRRESPLRGNLI